MYKAVCNYCGKQYIYEETDVYENKALNRDCVLCKNCNNQIYKLIKVGD